MQVRVRKGLRRELSEGTRERTTGEKLEGIKGDVVAEIIIQVKRNNIPVYV